MFMHKKYKENYNYDYSMATTIQISDITKQRLQALKKQLGARTYDKVLLVLTQEKGVEKFFGSAKGIGPWKKEYRARRAHD